MQVANIRQQLADKWLAKDIVSGRGGDTIEIIGASFLADEESIFGKLNKEYVARELAWYKSQSRNINTFPGGTPEIWKLCATPYGSINSNYGWCLASNENGRQGYHVLAELQRNPTSRRAIAIYTRPSMHTEAVNNGKQDFICTNAVEYYIRNNKLDCVVQMRSSDVVLGYRNDRAWHLCVLTELATELQVAVGSIIWQAGSLHIYERHFAYLEAICQSSMMLQQ